MSQRRVYEIARDRGLSTAELLGELDRAGVTGKATFSCVDDDVVERLLGPRTSAAAQHLPSNGNGHAAVNGRSNGNGSPATSDNGHSNGRMAPVDRLRLWRRAGELRRLSHSQLEALTGLAAELQADGRSDQSTEQRLATAAATDAELIEIDRRLGRDGVGGTCPECGLHTTRARFCLRCGERLPGRGTTDRLSVPAAGLAVLAVSAAWFLGGVGGGSSSHPDQAALRTRQAAAPVATLRGKHHRPLGAGFTALAASVHGSSVGIYHSPRSKRPYMTLHSPNLDGAKLVFMIKTVSGRWARVFLPTRPNGSLAWIHTRRVAIRGVRYRVVVNLTRHNLTVWKGHKRVVRTAVGVGRAVTPTPSGLYYITELLKQPDPTGTYGPYAFGLSAHSNVLHEFAGRDGVLGIHGTDFPQGVGTNVSHGCMRLSNAAITRLARMLPQGTPVRIVRQA
ncbi:MAG: hypothetical protein QOK31_594 [Solirubrobacteraceae bacterium]|nr:hypothetical protein [Solirubrobacteraceae bacterium]